MEERRAEQGTVFLTSSVVLTDFLKLGICASLVEIKTNYKQKTSQGSLGENDVLI